MTENEYITAVARDQAARAMLTALQTFAARAQQPGFDWARDDSLVTFFAKDVRAAEAAIAQAKAAGIKPWSNDHE